MAGGDKRNNRKRLDCLKKKSKELAVLCDVEVLFVSKEDDQSSSSSSSFHSWPEDFNVCFPLIDKYKKSIGSHSLLGKRKERSDEAILGKESKRFEMGFENNVGEESMRFEMGFENNVGEESRRFEMSFENNVGEEVKRFEMGFENNVGEESERSETSGYLRNIVENLEGIVGGVGYKDLEKMMGLIDEATKCVDERLHMLMGGGDHEEGAVSNFATGDCGGVNWEELMEILLSDDFEL